MKKSLALALASFFFRARVCSSLLRWSPFREESERKIFSFCSQTAVPARAIQRCPVKQPQNANLLDRQKKGNGLSCFLCFFLFLLCGCVRFIKRTSRSGRVESSLARYPSFARQEHDRKTPDDIADRKSETRSFGNPHAPTRGCSGKPES